MITINLLPPVKREPFWQAKHLYILASVLFIFCLTISWGYHFHREQLLLDELRQVRQQQELLKPTLAYMQEAATKKQSINARQVILISLTQERPPLHPALSRIGAIITEGVWLTDVTADKNGMKLVGMGKSYPDVAAFLQKVQTESFFTDFTLVRTEQDKTGAKFEFTVRFKGM